MFNLGMGEITVILVLLLLFVGPSKLPELASGLGKLIRQVRKATSDVKNEIVLDDSFRKPFEELRDAVTLSPDELKRRDQIKESLEAVRRQAEELAKAADRAWVTAARRRRPRPRPLPAAPVASATESAEPWPAPSAAPRRRADRHPRRTLAPVPPIGPARGHVPARADPGAAGAGPPGRRQRVTPPTPFAAARADRANTPRCSPRTTSCLSAGRAAAPPAHLPVSPAVAAPPASAACRESLRRPTS